MQHSRHIILGIESSCDDTAAAVLVDGELRSSIVSSQHEHEIWGGVVPELASRAHQRAIVPVVERALADAEVSRTDLSAIAVTSGPGLAGSLLVGLSFAKALALALDISFVGVNHLEGHLYSVFLEKSQPQFPYLCLIVSGGHTEIVIVGDHFEHEVLGRTRDDAAGEAFDKVAKLLGLGFPGGREIDERATLGDPEFVDFPRSRPGTYEFSFSGIKTAVLYYLNRFSDEERATHLDTHMNDICASFQRALVDVLIASLRDAITETGIPRFAVVGGVSANSELQRRAAALAGDLDANLFIPSPAFCTDNAAMIAMAGSMKLAAGITSPLSLSIDPNLKLQTQEPA